MEDSYLGDSYDLVKRFWSENLRAIGPLFASSEFVPEGIRDSYSRLTGIPILEGVPASTFGLLLDPNTGVPLPGNQIVGATRDHASLPYIVKVLNDLGPIYLICFDQSYHRVHELSRKDQRESKMQFLAEQKMVSFYYVSHAPFLFVARSADVLARIRDTLVSRGIPENRFEGLRRNAG